MSKCPDCNAEIYGSTYCVFCDWGKSAGISRLDALRTENEKLRARCEALEEFTTALRDEVKLWREFGQTSPEAMVKILGAAGAVANSKAKLEALNV